MDVPYERLLQVVFCDALALIFSGHYCYYLFLLIDRYAKLNKFLSDVKTRQAWEYTIFIRDKPNIEKANLLQEKYICKKIQMCANLYCMQYNAANQVCKKYGFGLVLTTTLAVNNIILYLFYFMEATASGLFNDLKRYIYFLFYVFWQTAYSTGIIFMAVYFSEKAVAKATDAIYITHNIINSNPSPAITKEAKTMSSQPTPTAAQLAPARVQLCITTAVYNNDLKVWGFTGLPVDFLRERRKTLSAILFHLSTLVHVPEHLVVNNPPLLDTNIRHNTIFTRKTKLLK
ncbi:unnamed protein product [Chilo suppressalis]|uniref:Gustatory receptor n=1 Tax=Chilo suppressalis TaxID=168631 RepID=A0ABN8BCB0_CHISP|nr:unnamed protein product [Chilo suppressalis]